MPTINFPSGPSNNDTYNLGLRTWKWNGEAWALQPLTGGFTGSAGAIGYSGSKGDLGYSGSKGDQGVIGYSGSKGDLGYSGSKGDQGTIGYSGSKGDQGTQGAIGYTGSIGVGYTGSTGVVAPLTIDTTNNRVGVNETAPEVPFHVKGNILRIESDSVSGRAIDLDANSASVEVNDNSNWLHLQRNHNGQVAVGAGSTANFYAANKGGIGVQPGNAGLTVQNDSVSDDTLLIQSTEDSSSAAPIITLKRNSSSPADADYIGQIKFKGENDNDQEVIYAKITAKIGDASDGAEDGIIEFANKNSGSNTITARLTHDTLKLINGTGLEVAGALTVGHVIPNANDTYDLGANGNVWRNIYTGDLHLSNETKDEGNVVDGTKGNWTIQEGAENLYILNNKTGKKYKFKLEEIS